MSLDLRDTHFAGPALPEPFVKFQLEDKLRKRGLLPAHEGSEGRRLEDSFDGYRRKLRDLVDHGGSVRVANHVLEPLTERLGYTTFERQETVATREGEEDGGWVLRNGGGPGLRAWAVDAGTDLDAPSRRGRAYRFSPSRVAHRVLIATGERAGLLTDGQELRFLLSDPARPESHVAFRLDRANGWRAARHLPDSYRLLLALGHAEGLKALPELTDEARLSQAAVTRKLREQARQAVEVFVQGVLSQPLNQAKLATQPRAELAQQLWTESLVLVYRLLFVLKLESSPDPARAFSFASTSLWRNTWSPSSALDQVVRRVIAEGLDTAGFLESSLRSLFRLFTEGVQSSELRVAPLGGMLFGPAATPTLDSLVWGERAVAGLLDRLLWTPGEGGAERHRVYYGSLDVEDLGRVYEALLELDPGITDRPMSRLRRAKLEVVVPAEQGTQYRDGGPSADQDDDAQDDNEEEDEPSRKGKTKVQWIEDIPEGRFYLRVGLGRKSTGSYYTPHPFVRFLVQETLGPQLAERSPRDNPRPADILKLKVLDPAMGSGHFLVEACRYLGEQLYEACRLADEMASEVESQAEAAANVGARGQLLARAAELRARIASLPDPNDELVRYLPSRAPEGEDVGLSQWKALAISRRLVTVHCLYGVDKNPLAVELAKLSLWLESYAEGLPLTFVDHRLVCGNSLTAPFYGALLTFPRSGESIPGLFAQGFRERLDAQLASALRHVNELEASVGKDVADLEQKKVAKAGLDAELEPFKSLAAVWTGAAMAEEGTEDAGYESLLGAVAQGQNWQGALEADDALKRLYRSGVSGVPFDLVFPEVFFPNGRREARGGFHAVVGNPPWDALQPLAKEFFASFDLRILDAPTRLERAAVEKGLLEDPGIAALFAAYTTEFEQAKRLISRLYHSINRQAEGQPSGAVMDVWQAFAERALELLDASDGADVPQGLQGRVGLVLPSAFHANQSATGIRELYLKHASLSSCYSFENRRKLFEIDSRLKFATVVVRRGAHGGEATSCAFYLHDPEWLFGSREPLQYLPEFIEKTGGGYYSLLELRSPKDVEVATQAYTATASFASFLLDRAISFGEEMHMSKAAHRFTPTNAVMPAGDDPRDPGIAARSRERGHLPLHEGKTFHQYDDRWGDRPRYVVALAAVADKPAWLDPARYYRLAFRDIASSTNERTGIFCLLPPGVLCGNTAPCERDPGRRSNCAALVTLALANSHSFDWTLRQKSAAHVNLFILNACPAPDLEERATFLMHGALRLTCNHAGYEPLWREQLGESWHEEMSVRAWPVLASASARLATRAAIDAVVAEAYGLSGEQYAHVLRSFSHASAPEMPGKCLEAFGRLQAIGFRAYAREQDPYWDVPLHETLAMPCLEFPGLVGTGGIADTGPLFAKQSHGGAVTGAGTVLLAAEPGGVYERLQSLLAGRETISSNDAQEALGLAGGAIRPALQRLVDEGYALREGRGRGTRYRIVRRGERH